ncbi:MAG: DUF1987 domain-containing protein [bacterium]
MEVLKIEGTIDSPQIILDPGNKKFELSGQSLPENPASFYAPVFEWCNKYKETPLESTTFDFKMEYLNTSSTKMITELIYKLKDIIDVGKELKIHWYYEPMDFDMKKLGTDISYITGIPFDFFELDEDE